MNKKTNDEKVILQLQDLRHLQWTKSGTHPVQQGPF